MTEVPEHLLRRSRERREALGLAGGSSPTGDGEETASPPAVAAAPAAAPAPAEPPAVPAEGAPAPAPTPAPAEEPVPSYIAPEAARSRIPVWVMPVLAMLPFWGILYVGAFGERTRPQAGDPGQLAYAANGCGSCHGTRGEGGVGPALAGGQSKLTFPNEADHANWIKTGSTAFAGQRYGDPNRPGGQRGPATGGMPGFGSLSDPELRALVAYERDRL